MGFLRKYGHQRFQFVMFCVVRITETSVNTLQRRWCR
jgi:hypothetical protein